MKTKYEIYHVDPLWIMEAWDGSACPCLLDDRPVSSHKTFSGALKKADGNFPRKGKGKYAILERSDNGLRVPAGIWQGPGVFV